MITGKMLRQDFLDYFLHKEHTWIPSSPVIPQNDPTLLFINAGMNQFKPIFLGKELPAHPRVVDYQKCIRVSGKHNDLEEVGRDGRHHTFFEMLGNWSFGDYYKREAIGYAWEFLTQTLSLPKDRLYATVYQDDDEAEQLWRTQTDIDPSHISRFGMKENFWEMGETGPCGPCSEIHFDRGERFATPGAIPRVNDDGERFCEIWNLVFIQYNRLPDGSLADLPSRHVDTGMGLERLTSIVQDRETNYDTDLFWPIIQHLEEMVGFPCQAGTPGIPFRVIADHIRALGFAIADGALPSNDGRGYVLRRLLRRAARFGHLISLKEPFIYRLVQPLVDMMGEAYPELVQQQTHIEHIIQNEEQRFFNTLSQGIHHFNRISQKVLSDHQPRISGNDAFTLYDTYGFPIDLTQLMASEVQMEVDLEGFTQLMNQQKELSRKSGKFLFQEGDNWNVLSNGTHSDYQGYQTPSLNTQIRRFRLVDKNLIEIILEQTPFYAESGGQVADTGWIRGQNFEINVTDVRKSMEGIIHSGTIEGEIIDPECSAQIDTVRLKHIARHHTSTHLLQSALRIVLGDHVHQSGSQVDPQRLRFDFTHIQALSDDELHRIENQVNTYIMSATPVSVSTMDLEEAKRSGAMALFSEKYDATVRVITIPEISRELCGGIHVNQTGEIGAFKILSESAVSAGIRRIEACSGFAALDLFQSQSVIIQQMTHLLNAPSHQIISQIQLRLDENHQLAKELEKIKSRSALQKLEEILPEAKSFQGISVLMTRLDGLDIQHLRQASDFFRQKLGDSLVILASPQENSTPIIISISENLTRSGVFHAGNLMKDVIGVCGGNGGGKAGFAQGGLKDASHLSEAYRLIQSKLEQS
ncbi:MAG: alanine--tRNA ligase [Candidatus Delongbacteria bacterium]|nr:alanine--tRNA ligase [Candidatus Delongbacteria bacterium]